MYICQQCLEASRSGQPSFKAVVEVRQTMYEGGKVGSEIVKELTVCGRCKGRFGDFNKHVKE